MEDPKCGRLRPSISRQVTPPVSVADNSLQQKLATLDVKKQLFDSAENNPNFKYYRKLQTVLSLCTYMDDLRQSLPQVVEVCRERVEKQYWPFVANRFEYKPVFKGDRVIVDDTSCLIYEANVGTTMRLPVGTIRFITPLGCALGYLIQEELGAAISADAPVFVDSNKMCRFIDKLLKAKEAIKYKYSHHYSTEEISELDALICHYQGEYLEAERNRLLGKDCGRIGCVQELAFAGHTYLNDTLIKAELKWLSPGNDYKANLVKWLGNLNQFMEMYCPSYIKSHLLFCKLIEHAKFYESYDDRLTKSGNILVQDTVQALLTELTSSESAIHMLATIVQKALLREKLRMSQPNRELYGKTIMPRFNEAVTFFEQPIAKTRNEQKSEDSKKQRASKKTSKKIKPRRVSYKTKEIVTTDHAAENEKIRVLKQQTRGNQGVQRNTSTSSEQGQTKKQLRLKPFKCRYTRSLARWHDPCFLKKKRYQ